MPEWMTSIGPAVVIGWSLFSSAVYAWHRAWPDAGYWLLAAGLNACVLLKGRI